MKSILRKFRNWAERFLSRVLIHVARPTLWRQETLINDYMRIRELRRLEEERFQQLITSPKLQIPFRIGE